MGWVFGPGAGIDVTHTLDSAILWVVSMAAGDDSKAFFFGEFHRIEHELLSVEPVKRLEPGGELGYVQWFQTQFYQEKLDQLEWPDELLHPCFGLIEFVAVGDQKLIGDSVYAFELDSSPILQKRAVVMVSTKPNNFSAKRLLTY
jgi:hypothetical protein